MLSAISGLGHRNLKYLIAHFGSVDQILSANRSQLLSVQGMRKNVAEKILSERPYDQADRILKACEQQRIQIVPFLSDAYPHRLKMVEDAPTYLFLRGKGSLNPIRSIAIVGTRKATSYGRETTQQIVEQLKAAGVQIVSGLAYGIDIEAHQTSLNLNMSTVGVIAGGHDRLYPPAHRKYAEQMEEKGGIISEQPPGTQPDAHLFPARNRIIAAMSDATIVVEAADKGGALITAALADSYNRSVFAVPGTLDRPYSKGTNQLLANQEALAYTRAEDLFDQLGWEPSQNPTTHDVPQQIDHLSNEERLVFRLLKEAGKSVDIDLIATHAELAMNKTASVLLSLEFQGLVKMEPGKKYRAR